MEDSLLDNQGRNPSVTVATLLTRSYAQFAKHRAVGAVTYQELGQRVASLRSGLYELGLRMGDRAILLTPNRVEFLVVEHALFSSGIIRVALSSRLHPREVAHIAQDCEASIVFADGPWAEALSGIRHEMPSVRHIIDLDASAPTPIAPISYLDLLTGGSPDDAFPSPAADDIAAILYTSGTTGLPKGAALSHRNWVAMMRNSLVEMPHLDESDVVLHVAPLSHFSGYVSTTCFVRGTSHIVAPRFDPYETLRLIQTDGVTILPLVPSMLNMLILAAEETEISTSGLRCVVYAGSAIAPDRVARAVKVFGPVLLQFYGLSETPMPLAALSMADHHLPSGRRPLPDRLASAGRINPFVELKLIDDGGDEVVPGVVGEIVVRSDAVMAGYWDQPDQTAAIIDDAGWASTGDLGRIDDDGYLYVVDRKKDMIVSGGYNVYPSEVENVISTLSSVLEVAVVGVPDQKWGEAVAAVIVRRPGHSLSAEEVVEVCTANLARFKLPRSVLFVDDLPRTGSGKVQRRKIREPYWAGQTRRIGT